MMNLEKIIDSNITIFIFFLLFVFITYYFSKKKLLIDSISKVQSINKSRAVLIGGIIFISYIVFFWKIDILYKIYLIILFFIGLLSDLKFLNNAKSRLAIIVFFTLIYAIYNNFTIDRTNIEFFDVFLENKIVAFIFVTFCISIVINGTNFIDGTNNNLNLYFFFLIIIILLITKNNNLILNNDYSKLIYPLLFLIFFNMINKVFLGDAGAYLIGGLAAISVIELINLNKNLTPFYAVLLLFYPCFEVLFSIVRKNFFSKINPLNPDKKHFHMHLVKLFSDKSEIYSHFLTSFLINFYIFLINLLALNYAYSTYSILLFVMLNTFIYIFSYYKLNRANKRKIS